MTRDAGEALHVEHLLHSDAPAAISNHIIATSSTAAKVVLCRWMVHVIHQLLCKTIQLIFWPGYRRRLLIVLIRPTVPWSGLTVVHSSFGHRHLIDSSRPIVCLGVHVLTLRVGMRRVPARLCLWRGAGHGLARRRRRVSLLRLPAGLGVCNGLRGFDLDAEARSRRSGRGGVGGRDRLRVGFWGGGLRGVVVMLMWGGVMRGGRGMVLRLGLRGVAHGGTAHWRGASVVRGLVVITWDVFAIRHIVVKLCAGVMWVTVQIRQHICERINICINFRVIM